MSGNNSMELRKVRCFGIRDEYITDVGVVKPVSVYDETHNVMRTEERMTVTVYNLISKQWEIYEMIEQPTICPICGTYIVVQAIAGVTWFAVCNPVCGDIFKSKMAELGGDMEATMAYFINERLKERQSAG